MWEIPVIILPFLVTIISYAKKKKVNVIHLPNYTTIKKIKLYLNRNEAWLYIDAYLKEPISNISVYTYVDGILMDTKELNITYDKGRHTIELLLTDKLPPLEHEVRFNIYFNNHLELILLYRYYYPPEAEPIEEGEIPSASVEEVIRRPFVNIVKGIKQIPRLLLI